MINVEFTSLKSLGMDSGTHFFGSPMLTKKLMQMKFVKEELFIGQINLSEIAHFDKARLLPDEGMIYIFFDVFTKKYSLFYETAQPDKFKEGFNKHFENNRYDHPLRLNLSIPEDDYDFNKNCVKLLTNLPKEASQSLNDNKEYICLIRFVPQVLDNLGRHYLIPFEKYSVIAIKKKHLKKGKLSKIITFNR